MSDEAIQNLDQNLGQDFDDYSFTVQLNNDEFKDFDGITLRNDMKIKDFKALVLNKTGNKPFYLEHHFKNTDTIKQLKDKTLQWNQKYLDK